jgi:hypothetical protein
MLCRCEQRVAAARSAKRGVESRRHPGGYLEPVTASVRILPGGDPQCSAAADFLCGGWEELVDDATAKRREDAEGCEETNDPCDVAPPRWR